MRTGRGRTRGWLVLGVLLAPLLAPASPVGATVQVGERAPDFTLPGTTGEPIRLSQFRGQKHVLLEFYVSDFGVT